MNHRKKRMKVLSMKRNKGTSKTDKRRQPKNSESLRKNTYFRSSESSYKRSELSRQLASNSKPLRGKNTSLRDSISPKRITFSGFVTIVIVSSFLAVILYASSVSTSGSTATLKTGSYQFRSSSEYETYINNYISSHILTRSKLLFPVSEFNEAFQENYPEVTHIETKVPFADRNIQVSIMTPDPLFRIAGSYDGTVVKYIDANGTVISSSKNSTDDKVPVLLVDSSVLTDVGTQLLTQNEVDILTLLKAEISKDNITNLPEDFTISRAELDIANGRLEVGFDGVDYIVRFSTYADARNQVGALKAILTELYSAGEGSELPREYIDVRVYEKVFIK